eukprot:m.64934 g.64934  ORF g.64934 m.64934 type:complete len:262 (-) comp7295_c2_seq1:249-1034(-)
MPRPLHPAHHLALALLVQSVGQRLSVLAHETFITSAMAWSCHGRTNADMVDALQRHHIIKSEAVARAMKAVDRGDFAPRDAYMDAPQPIGFSVTISAPHMHAYALEILLPVLRPGARVLDVGSGSGYLCACFHKLVGNEGIVVGIDHVPALVQASIANMRKHHGGALDDGSIRLVCGDGRQGWPEQAPYDAIHVGAAAWPLPAPLLAQLRPGGWIVAPVGPDGGDQYLQLIKKAADGAITTKNMMGVRYVPLTDVQDQLGE